MHTGYEDREIDASDEVGDDQRAHDDCRVHQTESRGGLIAPAWRVELSEGPGR